MGTDARVGSEAARLTGEVAEEAYFHHELGVLALCNGGLDRARAELEASIGLRGALSDKRGTVAGRRALALVEDRSGGPLPGGRTPAAEEVPPPRYEEPKAPPADVPPVAVTAQLPDPGVTLITRRDTPVGAAMPKARRTLFGGARRNLIAAGAGALLAAVLGTVVTLGATSNNNDGGQGDNVKQQQSANEGDGSGDLNADPTTRAAAPSRATPRAAVPASPRKPGATSKPGTSGQPAPDTSVTPSTPGKPSPGPSTPGPGKSSTPGKPPGTGRGSRRTRRPRTRRPTRPSPTRRPPPSTPTSVVAAGQRGQQPATTLHQVAAGFEPGRQNPDVQAPASSKPPTTSTSPTKSAPAA